MDLGQANLPANPAYESLPDDTIRLTAPWSQQWRGLLLLAPDGFRCDGASKPRLTWRVVGHPLQEPDIRGAILHDAAYCGELLCRPVADHDLLRTFLSPDDWAAVWLAPACADGMYVDVCRANGAPRWRGAVSWAVIRAHALTHPRRYVTAEAWKARQWERGRTWFAHDQVLGARCLYALGAA